ncbi:MAG: helix-turn-helix domain-containing protein [Candidatus Woesearchaeota archaeon]
MEEVLQEAGLSKNESIIYLKLSEVGMSSAYKIAKESKLFKANTYEALKKLEDKGLVSKKMVDDKTVYEAADPSMIMNIIDSKREKINKIIPSIRIMQKSTKTESTFNTYKGVDAFISILYHFLEYNDDILVYGAPKTAYEMIKTRIGNYHNQRIKKKIRMLHIYNFKAMQRIKQLKQKPYTPVRYLPALYDTLVSTNVCGDEVVFVIWKPPIKTIQIIDKDMAEAYKKYFKILWKNSKENK